MVVPLILFSFFLAYDYKVILIKRYTNDMTLNHSTLNAEKNSSEVIINP